MFFFCQAEDGIRDLVRSRGLGDVYKRQGYADNYDEDVTADRIRKATTATVPGNIPYIVLKRFGKTNIDGNLSSGYIMAVSYTHLTLPTSDLV